MAPAKYPPVSFPYRWGSRVVMPERWGQRCRVVAWIGAYEELRLGGACLVVARFEDGTVVRVKRRYLKRKLPGDVNRRCKARGCTRPVGDHGSNGMCGRCNLRARRAKDQG